MSSSIDLKALSRDALASLRDRVETELEARAFEDQLRRELQSHLSRQAWIDDHHQAQRRRR
ncbi:hypothetical protein SPICUR_06835 [Spiribacter curvatus]|uniref:Uncharacterized protein n=1 Tax=Spiribacter curvatus TaxID=1335757 RepID=U5T4W9_9GAMM|nr:hypothetical protein [Spiribacter curvatus]AGY92331.1 hypothetical protein SPICUR_06835 [Spiribacter curvatus]